jgi:ElaB/YqjD/DUF883 family membrane-anchored ribosome-binding protein
METTTKETKSTTSSRIPQSERAERKAQEVGTEIQRAWTDASSAIETLYTQASRELQHTVQERPYVALGVAAGIGFVLGGGLRSVTGRYLIRTTAQLVVPGVLAALRGEAD